MPSHMVYLELQSVDIVKLFLVDAGNQPESGHYRRKNRAREKAI